MHALHLAIYHPGRTPVARPACGPPLRVRLVTAYMSNMGMHRPLFVRQPCGSMDRGEARTCSNVQVN